MLLHVAADVNGNFGKLSNTHWWAGNIYGASVRWCVPIFVMLSGTFALNKYDGNLQGFFAKTGKRIALPFLFWSIFYLLYYNSKFLFGTQQSIYEKAYFIFGEIVNGSAVHLWFVCMILSMYLLFPFISKWVRYCSRKEIRLFLAIWFAYLTLKPFTENVDTHFDFSYFTGFIGYLILGNYLFAEQQKPNTVLLWILLLASFSFTVWGTYYLTQRDHELNESFLAGLTPNIVILSSSVYLLFKHSTIKAGSTFQKITDLVCQHSYGIFLIHILVLTLFNQYGFRYSLFNPILSIPVITLSCFLVSFALVYLLKKIPYAKYLIG